ncbi:MAG: hypothetical protein ORN49_06040 [Rhodobacteraceae bacterium]|nr:hypothetical protein [Paracoccaceae bacterium]
MAGLVKALGAGFAFVEREESRLWEAEKSALPVKSLQVFQKMILNQAIDFVFIYRLLFFFHSESTALPDCGKGWGVNTYPLLHRAKYIIIFLLRFFL